MALFQKGVTSILQLFICCCLALSSWAFSDAFADPDDPQNYHYPDALGVCALPWRPVLKLDELGNIVHGSVEELRSLVLSGHLVRVKLYRPKGPYLLNVDNTNVRGEHVCGQSLWHVSDNGTHVSVDADWRFHLLCTDGVVSVLSSPFARPAGWSMPLSASMAERIQDAALNFGNVVNEHLPMVWYAKEIGKGKPVFSHALDGTRIWGSMKNLIYMAKIGETRCVMRDRGYSFLVNNLVVDEVQQEVNGQSVGHVSQRFTSNALGFKTPPYYWFSSWTTSGRRDNSRWLVGTTQPRGHNNDYVALDWHVDSCWKEVYVNNQYGEPESGSLDELIFWVSLGHRVRVQYHTTVLEANSVRITGNTVVAQSIEEMRRRGGAGQDKYFFNTVTMWQWTTVHTTGRIRTYNFRVHDMSRYESNSMESQVRWMVDRRPWKRVWKTPPGPYDDHSHLVQAVERGASIRLNVQQDHSAGFFFTNADNVRLEELTGSVYAQCLRHISDQKDQAVEGEYRIQEMKPFYWFLMISSDGIMAMSAWFTQTRAQNYVKIQTPMPNITWFASA